MTEHRAWAIKLGSGGICIPFCERHGIVGLGWRDVNPSVVARGTRDDLVKHIREVCTYYTTEKARGAAVGQVHRFGRECCIDDNIVYYDPPKKHVRICRVTSGPLFRDFDADEPTDIWHYRRVEIAATIPIVGFYGGLKGTLLTPRMSFWEVRNAEAVDQLARGLDPSVVTAADPAIEEARSKLRDLVLARTEALDEKDWEWVVADYFRAQGANIDESAVGGNRPVIDIEARFDHGDLGAEVWRIQVKRHRAGIDSPSLRDLLDHAGDANINLCFVSVYGFTPEARAQASKDEILPLEAGDFVRFLLSGKVRESVRRKLKIPTL